MSQDIAVADLGGTHARFAIAEIAVGRIVSLSNPVTLNTSDYDGFDGAWRAFGQAIGTDLPAALAIAFAGPVEGDEIKLTNSGWQIRPSSLKERLGIGQIEIVNDFGAIAHAVAQLGPEDFDHICGPDVPPDEGVFTIVGPGTGLGVAQLLKADGGYQVVETEAGHIDFAPLDEVEDRILFDLRGKFGRVSVERLLSGSGLVNIHDALAAIDDRPPSGLDAKFLWAAALDGSDSLAQASLDRFFLMLGAVAGDLALAQGANAVVLAGGLGFRLRDRFSASGFADRFIAKGRFERRMKAIPVNLITHPQPGLFGAAAAFARKHA